ncbi:hypothetical protein Taro_031378 [Colocasia esculenta]|uniref:RING-type E3 ubiquitin transferase n=1 Tax=Colocasia esculenta TaxID=4460 RepID=A0A843W688_COLES|nr:hypothetical protein [Colocasia esculenta]
MTTDNLSRGEKTGIIGQEQREIALSSTSASCFLDRMNETTSPNLSTSTTAASGSPAENKLSLEMSSKEEQMFSILHNQLREAKEEREKSRKEASAELMKRKTVESGFADAINRLKMLEAACAHEIKLREELEVLIRTTKREQEQLSEQRDKAMKDLQDAMRAISVTENHIQEVEHHEEKVARELKCVEASIVNLKVERHKIRRGREEAACQQELWKHCSPPVPSSSDGFVRFAPFDLIEFSLSELQSATCDFSDSFKIVQGGSCCVYKGEILGKTVVIKKLQAHDLQGQKEFQEEVHVLSKLKHPHLVTLIGMCPEAWSLVYEYLPNGSLQDQFIQRTNTPLPLSWKVRMRIVAEVCSALLFLHSSKPESIIHGDLKPENIYLDPELHSKIGDIVVCRLVPEATLRCPSFRQNNEQAGAFPYTDPEYQRTGKPTAKSDIYSIGIIVLQLLTGRPPVGLATEVRRAILGGKLSSILDPTAGQWPLPSAVKLAEFGLSCSEANARERPELTPEVVRELEQLLVPVERPVPPFFLCPIRQVSKKRKPFCALTPATLFVTSWLHQTHVIFLPSVAVQEIMHDPVVAADGFTYEGEALRGWLQKGRETSPMTNLKLDHLNLTSNHALRFAIQDWLCRSR